MAETHAIAEALPTAGADDDQAASPGPIATGPTAPTQFRGRAARPTAIKLVEDMVPRATLVQAWALAEANPPPHQLQAMLAALAAQPLNAAEAAEAA